MSIELSWSKLRVANLEYVGIILLRLSGSLSFRYSVDDNLDGIEMWFVSS